MYIYLIWLYITLYWIGKTLLMNVLYCCIVEVDKMTHFRAICPPFPPFYHPRPNHHFRALAGIQYKLNGITSKKIFPNAGV